ncbi:MAG TPA: hypothetical protein VJ723_10780 [Candidatus Angelobacter sp.]|nr:hypothetical protein [Candidatus Angelobacter sp.]
MAEQEKDQHLDEMLDSLLESYSNAEPRPGMETRIVATLEAHTRQRRRNWILVFAGSAAVILLAVAITNARDLKQDVTVTNHDVPRQLPAISPGNVGKITPKTQTAIKRLDQQRRETPGKNEASNQAILQMANLTQLHLPADDSPSEPAPPYPTPVRRQNPEPAIAQLPSAPVISVGNLGVPTMEIKELTPVKELTPAKDADEKGNL